MLRRPCYITMLYNMLYSKVVLVYKMLYNRDTGIMMSIQTCYIACYITGGYTARWYITCYIAC